MDDKIPVYIGVTEIGELLGYRHSNIRYHYGRRESEHNHPCPAADAFVKDKHGTLTPLWLDHRTEDWEAWDQERRLLRPDGSRKPGRPAKPMPPNPKGRPET